MTCGEAAASQQACPHHPGHPGLPRLRQRRVQLHNQRLVNRAAHTATGRTSRLRAPSQRDRQSEGTRIPSGTSHKGTGDLRRGRTPGLQAPPEKTQAFPQSALHPESVAGRAKFWSLPLLKSTAPRLNKPPASRLRPTPFPPSAPSRVRLMPRPAVPARPAQCLPRGFSASDASPPDSLPPTRTH